MSLCGVERTPFTMRVPTRVTSPFRLSERTEVSTSVDPLSLGASSAAHSSSPAFSDCSVSLSCTSSQSSSRCCDTVCSRASCAASMGGHTAVDMAAGDGRRSSGRSSDCCSAVPRRSPGRVAISYAQFESLMPVMHSLCCSRSKAAQGAQGPRPSVLAKRPCLQPIALHSLERRDCSSSANIKSQVRASRP
jgi:hypothetical protein